MNIDKDKINEFAEKTGETITKGVKAGAKYTKEKAPLVGKAFLNFGHELKEIFTSKKQAEVVDVIDSTEQTDNTETGSQSENEESKSNTTNE